MRTIHSVRYGLVRSGERFGVQSFAARIAYGTGYALGGGSRSIRAFVKERLTSFKVPKHVLFLAEGDLAVTGSEKIKLAELREWPSGVC